MVLEEKFSKILVSLKKEVEVKKKKRESEKYEQLLDQIISLSNKGMQFLDESKLDESLDAFETVIRQLEDFQNES
ncbi:MAG: hypothetical protein ACFFAS_11900 [Promethearchaeota archaeon]